MGSDGKRMPPRRGAAPGVRGTGRIGMCWRTGADAERGMVTAELAIGLLTAAMAAAVAVFMVSLVMVQTRCGDTAAAMARQLARGDDRAAALARGTAPQGARVEVGHSASAVQVVVSVDEHLGRFGPFHLVGSAQAVLEPGVQP